jgi:hypothetical protein
LFSLYSWSFGGRWKIRKEGRKTRPEVHFLEDVSLPYILCPMQPPAANSILSKTKLYVYVPIIDKLTL